MENLSQHMRGTGGCYAGAPPRPRCARYDRYGVHKSLHFLISRARKRPIASTGRQGNCCSACRASTECEAAQLRDAVSLPDTHSEAEG